MFADEEDMIVIVVEDGNDRQVNETLKQEQEVNFDNYQEVLNENDLEVKYENDQEVRYENDQEVRYENDQEVRYESDQEVRYENDQEVVHEEEYQEEEEEMVLDEITGEIVSTKNVSSELNDSQNLNQLSISSNNNVAEEIITYTVPRPELPYAITTKRGSIRNNNKLSSKKKSPNHPKHRNRQLPFEEAHSLVQELRETYPELAEDKEMLINHVAELMREIKVPPIPEGYSRYCGGLYECTICEKSSHTKLKSELHYLESHGPRYLNCFSCGADFRCMPTLYRHERSCIHVDAPIVLKARALVSTRGSKRPTPVRKVSASRSWQICNVCKAVLSSKSSLEAHMCRHRNETPHKCTQCTRAYTTRSSLVRHMAQHDEKNKYECEQCQRVFRNRRLLVSHLATHNQHWPCPYKCGKYFATEQSKNLHVDVKHLNKPMPCACNLCHFRCFNISLLRCHMEQKHGLLYMSDHTLREISLEVRTSEAATIAASELSNNYDAEQAVNHLKEVFYVKSTNSENCVEVSTAPNEEGNDYYEIVLAPDEVNGLKEGYYEVVTSNDDQPKSYEEMIVDNEQEVCENECEVDAPGVDCGR